MFTSDESPPERLGFKNYYFFPRCDLVRAVCLPHAGDATKFSGCQAAWLQSPPRAPRVARQSRHRAVGQRLIGTASPVPFMPGLEQNVERAALPLKDLRVGYPAQLLDLTQDVTVCK